MPIKLTGPVCARRGCSRPEWKERLCVRCWRFGKLFGKPPELLIYDPLDGYRDDRDAVELSWDELDRFAEPS